MAAPKKRIGEMLLEAGIIDETQLKAALGHQRQWGVRLGQALVDLKLATEADIVRALSLKFGFEVAKLDALEPYGHEQALKLLPGEFAARNNVFPMWADTANLTVAMSDPTNLAVVDEVRFRTGRRVKVCIGGDQEIAGAVRRHYHAQGDVEAIALDLDADSEPGEAVFDPFGGGSKDALEAFFGGSSGDAAAGAAAPPPSASAPPPAATAPAAPSPATQAAAPAARPAAAPPSPPAPPPPARAAPAAPAPARPAAAAPSGAPAARQAAPQPALRAPAPAAAPPPARRPDATPPSTPAARPAAPPTRTATALPAQAVAAAPRPVAAPAPVPAAAAPPARAADLEAAGARELAEELTPLEEPAGEAALAPEPPLTPREAAILDSLERLARGLPAQPDLLKPTQAMAALIRLLVRKGLVTEREFLDELARK